MPTPERLTSRFYERLREEATLAPVFAEMDARHPHFVAYLEWGSRLAVINLQPGATADDKATMPEWGWGVPGGPFRG